MDRFRICYLCFRYPIDQRTLPECGHTFCLSCVVGYYDDRQRTSVMRIGALPCPVRTCRVFSPVPPDGVVQFPSDSETEVDRRNCPDVPDPHFRSKKRVTFSDKEETDNNRKSAQDPGSDDPLPVSGNPPSFRSVVKLSLGSILPQKGVDIPDSALILDPVAPAPPDTWTGSEDQGFNRKRLGESVFVFPSVVSVDNVEDETESDVSANENWNKNNDIERTRIDIVDGPGYLETMSPQQMNGMRIGSTTDREEEYNPDEMSSEVDLLWRIESRADQKPTSIALTEDNKGIIANYGLGTLETADETGVTTLTSEKLKPFTVILADVSGFQSISGCIVCADRRQKTVLFIHPETGELLTQWDPGFFAWVGGLGVLRNGNIVVSDRVHCCVGVYTPDGARVTEFGSYGVGDANICMADYLAVDSRDRVIVSDSANHCVKVFDDSGRFLAKISGRGASDGLLSWPKGVCVTPADNIVIADSKNGRVSMFSPNGEFIRHLVSDIPCPYGIAFGGRGNTIAVTHYTLSGYSQCDAYRLKTPV